VAHFLENHVGLTRLNDLDVVTIAGNRAVAQFGNVHPPSTRRYDRHVRRPPRDDTCGLTLQQTQGASGSPVAPPSRDVPRLTRDTIAVFDHGSFRRFENLRDGSHERFVSPRSCGPDVTGKDDKSRQDDQERNADLYILSSDRESFGAIAAIAAIIVTFPGI